jgi:glycosyltransferase involved in cell wall biosynthesis
LKHSDKPSLLLLTSSFPNSPDDETCGYIRDFASSLAADFNVTVLAPPDPAAVLWSTGHFTVTRYSSLLPQSVDPLTAGADLNDLASGSLLTKLAAVISLVCFFAQALVLALRADAICSHWMVPSGVVGAIIRRILGKPHVVVEHSGALHLLARIRGGRRVTRFIVKGSDRIVTVSLDLKRKLVALCPEASDHIDVIPMGVTVPSTGDMLNSTESTRTILFIGRLTEIKGLDVLMNAMSGLKDLRLIVAGDGERRKELECLALTLGLNAEFVGRISANERSRLLSKCNAVVIPSRVLSGGRTEGSPVVCLEAMAAGRLVIASRVGGLAETIVDGENGLLFDPGNCSLLKEKLLLGLSDGKLRRKLVENARGLTADFGWDQIGSRYTTVINRALRANDANGNRRCKTSSIRG